MAQNNVHGDGMGPDPGVPDFDSLFGDNAPMAEGGMTEIPAEFSGDFLDDDYDDEKIDVQIESLDAGAFPEITKNLEDVPHKAFDDPGYYKEALAGEGDISKRVHGILQKYLNAKDPKDKSVFRMQLIPAFW